MRHTLRRTAATLAADVPPLRRVHQWERNRVRPWLLAAARDPANRLRYGAGAPRLAERLWIDPSAVDEYMVAGSGLWSSASVTAAAFDAGQRRPIADDPIVHAAELRWLHGRPWEETGEVERMERAIARRGPMKGCRTRDDILARCRRLDEIFATVRLEGRLRTQGEVEPGTFRELGGIGVHIGPGGLPIRAANGRHRFAMARILGLSRIPVRVALVHPDAVPHLDLMRRPDADATPSRDSG